MYDAVSDVVESGGLWRSDFQIGSRMLKKGAIYIYGIQCNFMQTLKIADFTVLSGLRTLKITVY